MRSIYELIRKLSHDHDKKSRTNLSKRRYRVFRQKNRYKRERDDDECVLHKKHNCMRSIYELISKKSQDNTYQS